MHTLARPQTHCPLLRFHEALQQGLGVLITDHNVRETLGSCDRVYILTGGQITAHGLPAEVASHPEVRETYLGENFRL